MCTTHTVGNSDRIRRLPWHDRWSSDSR